VIALTLAAASGVVAPSLGAQQDGKNGEEEPDRVWRIEGLQTGFCVQLLLDPAKLDVEIPGGARPLRADAIEDLSPVLRTVITNQPEVAAWTPSNICLYFMGTVDVGGRRVSERNPRKAPMVGVWSLAASGPAGGAHRDVALRLFTNNGSLERAAREGGLDLRKVRSEVRDIPSTYDPDAPPIGIRREVRLENTRLIWEGRRVDDSTRASGPLALQWHADSRRGGPVDTRLVLTPEWTIAMAGSLRVEGDDDFAEAVKASPIRFVGPAVQGGGGELTIRQRRR
jgi:hypothetical protein